MVKKIKFPLEMANGVQVRSLEELQENFDLERVIAYYMNGKLLIWLKDRYYENAASQISKLDSKDENLKQKICSVFGVKEAASKDIDLVKLEERSKRIAELKKYTDNKEIIEDVNSVAFNQKELIDFLDKGLKLIYLCGRQFTIPLDKQNITYVGINTPIVVIKSETFVDFSKKNILLKGISYNKEYQDIIRNNVEKENKLEAKVVIAHYNTSALFDPMMRTIDRNESSKLFDVINNKLSAIKYDIDEKTKNRVDIIKHADLGGMFDNYLDRIS